MANVDRGESEDTTESFPVLRVRRDAELQRVLDEAREKTGMRSDSEVVRHALKMLVGRAA